MQELISAYGPRFLVAALGVSLALLCLFIVLWILRNRAPSPFVRGGRNRQPRLQVLDAAAVDTRRRIVLIRRDNVEHLVMIGGPTDIVIESGIGDERAYLNAQTVLQQAAAEQQELPKPAQQAALAASDAPAQPVAAPAPVAAAAAIEPPARRAPMPEPVRPAAAEAPVRPQTQSQSQPQPPSQSVAAERRPQPAPVRPAEPVTQRQPPTDALPLVTAAAAATPIAVAAAAPVAEPPRSVVMDTPAIGPAAVSAPVEPPALPEVSPMRPAARIEPMVAAEAEPVAIAPVNDAFTLAPELTTVPTVQPETAAPVPPIEPLRLDAIEPMMAEAAKPIPFEDNWRDHVEPEVVQPPVIDAPVAEDLLEAARQRVLAPAPAPVQARLVEPQQIEAMIERQPPIAANEPAPRDMSDFERVLEEEMALHLAADPAPTPALSRPPILPETRADRPRPPVAAILPEAGRAPNGTPNASQQGQEPNLQNEIARIFGEMSASRNT
jgi:flagellar biogenesis protein FliO